MSISFPSVDFTPSLAGYTGQGPFRFWCQKVLPIVYDDSLSYYELLNKMVIYLNNVIKDVASNIENVDKLFNAYNLLQEYVNNYFASLDVQEEINNKLDNMAESGELGLSVIEAIARIWGWGLPEMFGAKGDGESDDTAAIQLCIDSFDRVLFTSEKYMISDTIKISASNKELKSLNHSKIERLQQELESTKYNMLLIGNDTDYENEVKDDKPSISSISIDSIYFVGNEFNYKDDYPDSVGGQTIDDGRTCIKIIRVIGMNINDCDFAKIGSNGVYCKWCEDVIVGRSEFSREKGTYPSTYAHSISFQFCRNVTVFNSYFHDIDDGISAWGILNDYSEDCGHSYCYNKFERIYEHGIYFMGVGGIIDSNNCIDCYADPIKVRAISTVVSNNNIVGQGSGITVGEPSRYCCVTGNNILLRSSVRQPAIGIGVGGGNLKNVVDPPAPEPGQTAREPYPGTSTSDRMIGNSIRDNTITLAGGSEIQDNWCGIRLQGSTDYPSGDDAAIQQTDVVNNSIKGFPCGIIMLQNCEGTTINNNVMQGRGKNWVEGSNYACGFVQAGTICRNTTLFGNKISNYLNGIRFNSSPVYTVVSNNILMGNKLGAKFQTLSNALSVIMNRFLNNDEDYNPVGNMNVFQQNSEYDRRGVYPYIPYANTPPETGKWVKGEMVKNPSPTKANPIGWICVEGTTDETPAVFAPMYPPKISQTAAPDPTDRTWNVGDIVWNSAPNASALIVGWICVRKATASVDAVWVSF